MIFELHEDLLNHVKSFQLSQPLNKRHYITFAIAKIRDKEELTEYENEAIADLIIYCSK